jgi:hypothetical protein
MDLEQTREYLAGVDRTRAEFLRATGRPDPFVEKIKTAVWTLVAPRLALDATMPDLDDAVAGTDRGNFHSRRKMIGDRVRKLVRGKLGRDQDLDDLDELLSALERERDGEAEDREYRHSRDGEPESDPWREPEAEALDAVLEELRDRLPRDAYDRLVRARAEDRRRREAGDRKQRLGRDMPVEGFNNFSNLGTGSERSSFNNFENVGSGQDQRPRFQKFGEDSAPTGFAARFKFTRRAVTEGQSRIPGRAGGVY